MHKWLWGVGKSKLDKNPFKEIKGSCTSFALIIMLDWWLKVIDNSEDKTYVEAVLVNYAQAFTT